MELQTDRLRVILQTREEVERMIEAMSESRIERRRPVGARVSRRASRYRRGRRKL
jgi:hypothetical protein